jgi:hypothetical protein
MTDRDRRLTTTSPGGSEPRAVDQEVPAAPLRSRHAPPTGMANRLTRPHSREEAEERYVAAREAWTAAMRAANSGRSSDLAALAMAQEAYEEALADRERWASSPAVAIPIGKERPSSLDAVVGQEISWRRVHEHELEIERAREQPRGLRGLLRRLGRR